MVETRDPRARPAACSGDRAPARPAAVLFTACLALFVSTLDNSVANVALPSIGRSLHAGAAQLQWVVDAYIVARGSLLLTAGALGDRFGRRRMFRYGLAVFGAGSLLCSLAPTADLLIAARVLQATGGCFLVPSSLALVTEAYPEPDRRARAIGIWSATIAVSTGLGPPLGGLLVEVAGWRSVFWINLPVVALALVLVSRHVRPSAGDRTRRLDPVGQLLVALALLTGISGFISASSAGWSDPLVLGLFAGSAVATAAFVAVEFRVAQPLLAPALFRSPAFCGAAAVATTAFVVYAGFLFVNTLYLQDVRGYSPLRAGLVVMPATIGNLVLSPLSGRMTAARGPRLPVLAAALALLAGSLVLAYGASDAPAAVLMVGYVLLGSGVGLVNTPITDAAVAGLPPERAGVAGAVTSMFRQIGNSLGVALFGTLALSGVGAAREGFLSGAGGSVQPSAADAYTAGLQHAYVASAAFAVLTLVIAAATFRPQRPLPQG